MSGSSAEKKRRKVLVIGLDGMCMDVMNALITEDRLPYLESIIQNGAIGRLRSTIPPASAPAWVSFMTGMNPGKHGVFDFTKQSTEGFGRRFVSSKDVSAPTLWSILSAFKKEVGIINVPITFPPSQVNGFMITGMLTPDVDGEWTYPPSLKRELTGRDKRYEETFQWQHKDWRRCDGGRAHQYLRDSIDCLARRTEAILYLMDKFDWDFFAAVFTEPDRIQHALWRYIDPDCSVSEKGRDRGIKVLLDRFYRSLDDHLGQICNRIDSDTTLFIISDHGFGPWYRKMYMNKWLHDQGFLKIDWGKLYLYKAFRSQGQLLYKILKLISNVDLRRKFWRKAMGADRAIAPRTLYNCIDWTKTKAYFASNTEQGIYINVAGREPRGIVQEGKEYEETRDSIIERLRQVRDPQTGEKLHSHIFKREEVYTGPHVNEAPDILFILRDGEYLGVSELRNRTFDSEPQRLGRGIHRIDGICAVSGEAIKKGAEFCARIVDLFPTILYQMGLPIPEDVDGAVMKAIFNDSFLGSHPISYAEALEPVEQPGREQVFSEEQSRKLKDRLRGLGYID